MNRAIEDVEGFLRDGQRVVIVSQQAELLREQFEAEGSVAQTLYTESPESRAAREQQALQRRLARTPGDDLGARPTKQARRRLDALRRGQGNSRRD